MNGLYIHIPFCRHKCLYCDFYTGGVRIADWDSYVKSLLKELGKRSEELVLPISTMYFGGGTPSLIPDSNLFKLIEGVYDIIPGLNLKEFTIEVNPEDVTPEIINVWKRVGINRVSLGVQSFNDRELILIGRKHDSEKALMAIEELTKEFDNVSVDIMFGLPGQTIESYSQTLDKVLETSVTHLSSYSLMLEEGTAMTHFYKKNKIFLPSESEWKQMYDLTISKLLTKGLKRYEISNFSLPGKESLHNLTYWNGGAYMGLGPGAHSYDGFRVRRWNPNDIKGYLKTYGQEMNNEGSLFYEEEGLSDEELREEMVMTRMRTVKGLNLNDFELRFGNQQKEILLHSSHKYITEGLLQKEENYLRFTQDGFTLSDFILSELI